MSLWVWNLWWSVAENELTHQKQSRKLIGWKLPVLVVPLRDNGSQLADEIRVFSLKVAGRTPHSWYLSSSSPKTLMYSCVDLLFLTLSFPLFFPDRDVSSVPTKMEPSRGQITEVDPIPHAPMLSLFTRRRHVDGPLADWESYVAVCCVCACAHCFHRSVL